MQFQFIVKRLNTKIFLFILIALCMVGYVYPTQPNHDDKFLEKKFKKLALKIADTQMGIYKNAIARNTIHTTWMTLAYLFITADKSFTFKNLVIAFILGGWIGVSTDWHKYLKANKGALDRKYEFYKKAFEEMQLALDASGQLIDEQEKLQVI